MSKLPIIDLNLIENEDQLYPIVKNILMSNDTFILKNFANIDNLYNSINNLGRYFDSIDGDTSISENGNNNTNTQNCNPLSLDSNFTGLTKINRYCFMEQYIKDNNNSNIFNTRNLIDSPNNINNNNSLQSVYERLIKILFFFTNIALETITSRETIQNFYGNNNINTENNEDSLPIDITQNYATKFTRYYNILNGSINDNTALNDIDEINDLVKFNNNLLINNNSSVNPSTPTSSSSLGNNTQNFKLIENSGLMQVFPMAQNIKFKPVTSSLNDKIWSQVVTEPNCLLFHTGKLLQTWSNGLHSTTPLMINYNNLGLKTETLSNENSDNIPDPISDLIYLTIYPNLSNPTVLNNLLIEQINEFPNIGSKYYIKELNEQKLMKKLNFYKELFNISETVLSLFSMSMRMNSRSKIPELINILPQMTNLLKKKVTQDDFLKMVYIWPEAYVLEINNKGLITVKLPKQDSLKLLTNNSRKLQFINKLDALSPSLSHQNLVDVPIFKINKRRASSSDGMRPKIINSGSNTPPNLESTNSAGIIPTNSNNINNQDKYLHNEIKSFKYNEKPADSQANLLSRLKQKEAKSKELLQQRQLQYEKFLRTKMNQIYEILKNLQFNMPYTETYLVDLIVDSLRDSNNPIGKDEVQSILFKLYELNGSKIKLITMDSNLKIYRWLNKLSDIKFD